MHACMPLSLSPSPSALLLYSLLACLAVLVAVAVDAALRARPFTSACMFSFYSLSCPPLFLSAASVYISSFTTNTTSRTSNANER